MSKQADYSAERCEKVGRSVMNLDAIMQGWRSFENEIVGLSIRCPRVEGEEYLVTVRGLDAEGQAVIAFHSAYNLLELLIGLWGRISNGTLRWKPDTWGR